MAEVINPISFFMEPFLKYKEYKLNKKKTEVEIETAIQERGQAKVEHEREWGKDIMGPPAMPSQLRPGGGNVAQNWPEGAMRVVGREPGLKERDVASRETIAATGARGDPPSVANTMMSQEKYDEIVGMFTDMDKEHGTKLSQGLSSVFKGIEKRIGKATPVDILAAFRTTLEDPATRKKLIRSLELSKPQHGGGTGMPLIRGARAEDSQAAQEIDMMIESVKDGTFADKAMPESAAVLNRADATRLGKETMYPTAEKGYQPASIAQGLKKATTKDTKREDIKDIRSWTAKFFGYSDYQSMQKDAVPSMVDASVRAIRYYESGQYSPDEAMQKAIKEDPFFYKEMVEKQFPGAVEEPEGSGNFFVTDESGIKRPVLMRAQ